MSKFFDWLDNRLNEYAANRERALKAHATRWAQVAAKMNSGVLPTESERDGVIRFHAPHDGYIHAWTEGDEHLERTYLGGQYLPYDKLEVSMWGDVTLAGCGITGVPIERAKKFMDEPRMKKAIKQLNICRGHDYQEKRSGTKVCNIYLNNCPEDIRRAIDLYLMGDIYKLRQVQDQVEEDERAKRDAAHENGQDAPEGREVITGEILTFKWQQSMYGDTLKMLVQDDRGFRVWGSKPSALNASRGDRITFVATVERSERDLRFGFFKRPAKAEVLNQTEAA